jgi:hypothetical protein
MEKAETFVRARARSYENSELQNCISLCMDCSRSCFSCISHCLTMGGPHSAPEHINLMQACSLICEVTAKLMMIEFEFYHDFCKICADTCNECADSCESIDQNDSMMSECAESCRRCADSCEQMALH